MITSHGPFAEKSSKIIVAIDGSKPSINALKWSIENISTKNNFYLLCVGRLNQDWGLMVQSALGVYFTCELLDADVVSVDVPQAYEDEEKKLKILNECEKTLETAYEQVKQSIPENEFNFEFIPKVGDDPKQVICDFAQDVGADLLIVGDRGLSAIKRMLLGSVSDYCVHNTKCPVLVVKYPISSD